MEIRDRVQWNQWLLGQPTQAGIFLQSWEWLDFQESLGKKIWRLGIISDGAHESQRLIGVCGLVQQHLSMRINYFYAPRGPLADYKLSAEKYRLFFEAIKDEIREFLTNEHIIFWRFEPMANLAPLPRGTHGYGAESIIEATSLHTEHGRHLIGHSRRVLSVQPRQTIMVDLSDDEERLLSRMHEKTRYNIRLAERKGIKVENVECERQNVEIFLNLLRETVKRDKFKTHSEEYYRKMIDVLGAETLKRGNTETFSVRLWLAYANNEPAAGAIIGYFGDTATYLHGASSYKHRALMAPYLLHWEVMRQAKIAGYKWYDFWGIDEKKWPGITRFKKGFDGRELAYPGTFDLPFNKFWYKLYRLKKIFF